jgi:hypothetical protein
MNRKAFVALADIVVELNIRYPFSGEIVNYTEIKLLQFLRDYDTFDKKKWDTYINKQIKEKFDGRDIKWTPKP